MNQTVTMFMECFLYQPIHLINQTISYSLELSTKSNTHAARENLPRLVALRNLFAIVFSFSTTLPYFGEISEANQARQIPACCMGIWGDWLGYPANINVENNGTVGYVGNS